MDNKDLRDQPEQEAHQEQKVNKEMQEPTEEKVNKDKKEK